MGSERGTRFGPRQEAKRGKRTPALVLPLPWNGSAVQSVASSNEGEIKLLQDFFGVVFFCRVVGWLVNGGNLLQRLSHDLNGFRVHGGDDTELHSMWHPQKVHRFPFPFRRVGLFFYLSVPLFFMV